MALVAPPLRPRRPDSHPVGAMSQQSLFPPLVHPPTVEGETISERFRSFHELNPHVYESLVGMAMRLRRNGRLKWGLKGLFEVLRWSQAIATQGDEYRLNNNYTALYARLIMEQEPALEGFFDVRERRAK